MSHMFRWSAATSSARPFIRAPEVRSEGACPRARQASRGHRQMKETE